MNLLKHPIYQNIYDLCQEIEKLPASEQATKVAVMASNLEKPVDALIAERDRWHSIADNMKEMRIACEKGRDEFKWDIEAYRGALGYAVAESHTGNLTDGTRPQCGMCNSAHRKANRQEEALKWIKDFTGAFNHPHNHGTAEINKVASEALEAADCGQILSLRQESAWAALEEMREALKEHHDKDQEECLVFFKGDDVDTHATNLGEAYAESPLADKTTHALSTSCGQPLLERVKRLEEALKISEGFRKERDTLAARIAAMRKLLKHSWDEDGMAEIANKPCDSHNYSCADSGIPVTDYCFPCYSKAMAEELKAQPDFERLYVAEKADNEKLKARFAAVSKALALTATGG